MHVMAEPGDFSRVTSVEVRRKQTAENSDGLGGKTQVSSLLLSSLELSDTKDYEP